MKVDWFQYGHCSLVSLSHVDIEIALSSQACCKKAESAPRTHTKSRPRCRWYPSHTCRSIAPSPARRLTLVVSMVPGMCDRMRLTGDRALEAPRCASRSIVASVHASRHTLSVRSLGRVIDHAIAGLPTTNGPNGTVHISVETFGVGRVRETVRAHRDRVPSLRWRWLGWRWEDAAILRRDKGCVYQQGL